MYCDQDPEFMIAELGKIWLRYILVDSYVYFHLKYLKRLSYTFCIPQACKIYFKYSMSNQFNLDSIFIIPNPICYRQKKETTCFLCI